MDKTDLSLLVSIVGTLTTILVAVLGAVAGLIAVAYIAGGATVFLLSRAQGKK